MSSSIQIPRGIDQFPVYIFSGIGKPFSIPSPLFLQENLRDVKSRLPHIILARDTSMLTLLTDDNYVFITRGIVPYKLIFFDLRNARIFLSLEA